MIKKYIYTYIFFFSKGLFEKMQGGNGGVFDAENFKNLKNFEDADVEKVFQQMLGDSKNTEFFFYYYFFLFKKTKKLSI
jgi:hypothetical protein